MNVKLSHTEVIQACQEWLMKHHGLKVSEYEPVVSTYKQNSIICIEFPGIEPCTDKPETPYRG